MYHNIENENFRYYKTTFYLACLAIFSFKALIYYSCEAPRNCIELLTKFVIKAQSFVAEYCKVNVHSEGTRIMMKSGRYIGVMSGTSLDGVDVVLAAISDKFVAEQSSLSVAFPIEVKKRILDICQGQATTLSEIGKIDRELGSLYADAINQLLIQTGLTAEDIIAIGCHGQTVWHEPDGEQPLLCS